MNSKPTFPAYRPSGQQLGALAGVRVVDFSRYLAGPFSTQMLGDLGADVLKIEHPRTGDDTRSVMGPTAPTLGGESFFYLALNRNKRSIALDINTDAGREIIFRLLEDADVLVESFTTRVMLRAGLDYAALKDRFPKLIYCSISAYGRIGRLANAGGFDGAISVEAGIASLNALPGEIPMPGVVPFIDITTGMNSTIGILAALRARDTQGTETFGQGQFLDIAMYDTAIADLSYKGYQYLASGVNPENPSALGGRPKFGSPGGVFECAEGGLIWFTVTSQKMYQSLCDNVVERPDLKDDPRFVTIVDRGVNFDALAATMRPIFAARDRAYWGERLKSSGIPSGEIRSVGEALSSEQTIEREMVFMIPHPTADSIPIIASPIKMSLTPPADPTAPPLLGEHTVEIMQEVGYTDLQIHELDQSGVIKTN